MNVDLSKHMGKFIEYDHTNIHIYTFKNLASIESGGVELSVKYRSI
jgi:hypothetical protein